MKKTGLLHPSLAVKPLSMVLYAILALGLTTALFATLSAFNVIGRNTRLVFELVEAPAVTPPPLKDPRRMNTQKPRKIEKPKLVMKQDLRAPKPVRPIPTLNTSFTLPMTSLQPGLGDVSIRFDVASPQATEPAPLEAKNYTISDLDAAPRLLALVKPLYPLKARQRGIEGYVNIEFAIETDGTVDLVRVLQSDPPGTFDEAACTAARRWRFSAPKKDGKAVKVLARQRIEFSLEK